MDAVCTAPVPQESRIRNAVQHPQNPYADWILEIQNRKSRNFLKIHTDNPILRDP